MYYDPETKQKSISFGTTQDRGLFPHISSADRTGNELNPIKGAPNRGPGCYNNAELLDGGIYNMVVDPSWSGAQITKLTGEIRKNMTSFTHNLESWICSKRGYTYGSRTAPRFRKEFKTLTPSPFAYQNDWMKEKESKPAYKPFEVSAERFHEITIDPMITPGPGVYEHKVERNRHIIWPQQFGRPIQPIQPHLERRTIKTELLSDVEFRKFRNRVAYFRLYY